MKVKNSIKKVGAVAGSALMVGLTMGSAASLAEFPQPFVQEDGTVSSQIVVGSTGKVADVVGAVNLAAAMGQSAVQTETRAVPGSSAEVNGKQYDVSVRDSVNGNWLDKSSYSKLARETVMDQNDNEVRVLERIQGDFGTAVNQTDVVTSVSQDAVQYEVSYSPGFAVGDSIPVLGQNYEVTAITDNGNGVPQVELGSKKVEENLQLDDSYTHGPYTVTVVDKDESGNGKIYLQVEKNGETLTSFGLSTTDTKTVDGALEITADEVFFGSRSDYIDVTSVYTDTTVTQNEDSPFDSDYTVSNIAGGNFSSSYPDEGTVQGLTLQNDLRTTSQDPAETDDEDDISRLKVGESFAGPSDYFSLTSQGLTEESMDEVTVKENNQVSFTDTLGISQTLDASKATVAFDGSTNVTSGDYYVDVNDRPFKVSVSNLDHAANTADVTVSYEGFKESATFNGNTTAIDVDTGYGAYVEVTSDFAGGANELYLTITDDGAANDNTDLNLNTEHDNTLTWDGTATELDIAEVDSDGGNTVSTVNVSYAADGTINGASDHGAGEWALMSENGQTLSRMGSVVKTAESLASVSVSIPENQRVAQFALGSTEATGSSDETYEALTGAQTLPNVARLDSEVTSSVRSSQHLILVGGPAVNTLVDELVSNGDVDMSSLEGQDSGALLQTVDNAFAEGQDALVVAGIAGDDTRAAAQYLSNYADHEQALSDAGDRMVLESADYPAER